MQVSDEASLRIQLTHQVDAARRTWGFTWFASSQPLEDLMTEFSNRFDARLAEGDVEVMMRFADGRVLPELNAVMATAQRSAYFAFATSWWYLDRTHVPRSLQLGLLSEAVTTRFVPPLLLDGHQEQALLDAAEPDSIARILKDHSPVQFEALAPSTRHQFVKASIAKAKGYGLQTAVELAQFCMVGLEEGMDFHQGDRWAHALAEVRARRISMTEAVNRVCA